MDSLPEAAVRARSHSGTTLWNRGAESPPHWHDHDQVIYVLAGSGQIVVGDEEVALSAGDVVVAPARIPHQVRAADEGLDTLVAMPATLRTFRPDGSEIQQPWHT